MSLMNFWNQVLNKYFWKQAKLYSLPKLSRFVDYTSVPREIVLRLISSLKNLFWPLYLLIFDSYLYHFVYSHSICIIGCSCYLISETLQNSFSTWDSPFTLCLVMNVSCLMFTLLYWSPKLLYSLRAGRDFKIPSWTRCKAAFLASFLGRPWQFLFLWLVSPGDLCDLITNC